MSQGQSEADGGSRAGSEGETGDGRRRVKTTLDLMGLTGVHNGPDSDAHEEKLYLPSPND